MLYHFTSLCPPTPLAPSPVYSLMLRWLQWRRLKPHVEVTVTFGGAYLCFYIANSYLKASGTLAAVDLILAHFM